MRANGIAWVLGCIALVLSGVCEAQRPGGFQVIGPGGGGAMFNPTISPIDPKTVLVACDMSGVYLTHDGGESWRMINLRGGAKAFAFDPKDRAVMYVLGIGLWQSRDGGATWHMILPRESKVTSVQGNTEDGDVQIVTSDEMGSWGGLLPPVSSMTIDPQDGRRLYVTVGDKLWMSKDRGEKWQLLTNIPEYIDHIALAPGSGTPDAPDFWLAGARGFWRLRHGKAQQVASPADSKWMTEEQIEVIGGKTVLMAMSDDKLYRAVVGGGDATPGVNWRELVLRPGVRVKTMASGHDGHTIYASFTRWGHMGQTYQGVAKSTDAGMTWMPMWKDAGRGDENFTDGWLTESLGSMWGDEPQGMAVAESDHAVVYATDTGRTSKSIDGGVHWVALYSHKAPNGRAVSSGLDVLTEYGVHFDPFDKKRMFVDYTDIGLFRSEDGGHSWISSRTGIPRKWSNTAYWMEFDPAVRGLAWVAVSGTHDLPRSRIWRREGATDRFLGGVCVSTDGGEHWTPSSTGMPEAAATHVLMDTKSSVGNRTLYVSTMGKGVYKSLDGGKSWSAKNSGLPPSGLFAWRLALAGDGTLYVLIARRSEDGKIGNALDGALYRSRNGAESWEKVALPAGVNAPSGLTIDPQNPARMYLAAWARATGPHGEGGGIYATSDAGAHWTLLFGRDPFVYDVTLNPANPAEMYASGFSSSAWRSVDRGAHWQRIAGYNFKAGHRVIADPTHPGMVYITTFGGGVWHGPVDGKPVVEDITAKEIAP